VFSIQVWEPSRISIDTKGVISKYDDDEITMMRFDRSINEFDSPIKSENFTNISETSTIQEEFTSGPEF